MSKEMSPEDSLKMYQLRKEWGARIRVPSVEHGYLTDEEMECLLLAILHGRDQVPKEEVQWIMNRFTAIKQEWATLSLALSSGIPGFVRHNGELCLVIPDQVGRELAEREALEAEKPAANLGGER